MDILIIWRQHGNDGIDCMIISLYKAMASMHFSMVQLIYIVVTKIAEPSEARNVHNNYMQPWIGVLNGWPWAIQRIECTPLMRAIHPILDCAFHKLFSI